MKASKYLLVALQMLLICEEHKDEKITSAYLASKIGCDPVIVRQLMTSFRDAGIMESKVGSGGITMLKSLSEITMFDIYQIVEINFCKAASADVMSMVFYSSGINAGPEEFAMHDAINDSLQEQYFAYINKMKEESISDLYKRYKKCTKRYK